MSEVSIETIHTWDNLDPKTRTILAGFSRQVGETEGMLSMADFYRGAHEGFDEISEEDMGKTLFHGGSFGVHNLLSTRLQVLDPDEQRAILENIRKMAEEEPGLSHESLEALSEQVLDSLQRERAYDTIPALRVLSEIAAKQLVPKQTPPAE